jgi:hypothetical protein
MTNDEGRLNRRMSYEETLKHRKPAKVASSRIERFCL